MTYGNSAAVALNNLDTLRSYGSAGDELENFPPDYLRNLNRSTPVPNPTLALTNTAVGNATLSDTDSLHKPIWQEQMHLVSFNSDTAKIKNGKYSVNRIFLTHNLFISSSSSSSFLLLRLFIEYTLNFACSMFINCS